LPNQFVPGPYIYSDGGGKEDYLPLFATIAFKGLNSDRPYDQCCPSSINGSFSLASRTCANCLIYHSSITLLKKHTKYCKPAKIVNEKVVERIRPKRIAAMRANVLLVELANGEKEWYENEDVEFDNSEHIDVTEADLVAPTIAVADVMETPWIEAADEELLGDE
jgi:hypothetical protein